MQQRGDLRGTSARFRAPASNRRGRRVGLKEMAVFWFSHPFCPELRGIMQCTFTLLYAFSDPLCRRKAIVIRPCFKRQRPRLRVETVEKQARLPQVQLDKPSPVTIHADPIARIGMEAKLLRLVLLARCSNSRAFSQSRLRSCFSTPPLVHSFLTCSKKFGSGQKISARPPGRPAPAAAGEAGFLKVKARTGQTCGCCRIIFSGRIHRVRPWRPTSRV